MSFSPIKKDVPEILKLGGVDPMFWADVSARNSRRCPVVFFDLSKGRRDPLFRYLAIITDQYPGFDEFYLVCYFDRSGNWITQSSFDTLQEPLDHSGYAFRVCAGHWHGAS